MSTTIDGTTINPPIVTSSTQLVVHLNADLLDNQEGAFY